MITEKHKANAYDIRPYEQAMFDADRQKRKAEELAKAAENKYKDMVLARWPNATITGGLWGGQACMNSLIAYHVFVDHYCVFCGCDDHPDI